MDKKLILAVVGGFVGGFVVGYFATKHYLEQHYIDLANEEIKDAKEYYESVADERTGSTAPDGRERIFYSTLKQYQGVAPVQTDQTGASEVLKNIFRDPRPEPSFAEEMEQRDPEHPYIISAPEYLGNDSNYSQETVTWYEGDGVLSDDRDEIVEDPDATIGLGNLQFGHRSDDENVVYIRNDRLLIDFEVLRHDGKFAVVVMGLDPQQVT
jgi:hypothetical protein